MREYDIILGKRKWKYLTLPGQAHVAVYAATGKGKGASFVIPNCYHFPGSLVVLDIKGEAWEATAGHRRAMGQDVYKFDPMPDGRVSYDTAHSHRWNPFDNVERTSLKRFSQISQLANLIFPEIAQVGSGSNANKFWEDAGRLSMISIPTLIAETPDLPLSMWFVSRLFRRGDSYDMLEKIVADRRAAGGSPLSMLAVDGVSDYLNRPDTLRENIRTTVSTRLQVWSDPYIEAATATSDFNLRDLRRKPMTIYITVAPGNIAQLQPLLRLFFDQLIALNTDVTPAQDPSVKYQTLLLLDEFAQLGRIDRLARAAQYVRGFGMRMGFIIQNKAQIRSIYGKDSAIDIFDNLGAEIAFGTNDLDLLDELEKRLGDTTQIFTTRNRPRFMSWAHPSKQTASEHPHRRPLMLKQEIRELDDTRQIILRSGLRPVLCEKNQWWSDKNFASLRRPPPSVPPLTVQVALDDGSVRVARPKPPNTGNFAALLGSAIPATP